MYQHIIRQISNIVEDAVSKRPMTWEGNPMPALSVADPLGGLPVIAAAACNVCEELNIKSPLLRLQPTPDASFEYELAALQISIHGIGAFMLVLRDTIINCDRRMELMLPSLGAYIEAHPEAVLTPHPEQESP